MPTWVVEDRTREVLGNVLAVARRIIDGGGDALVVMEAFDDGYRVMVARQYAPWASRLGLVNMAFARVRVGRLVLPARLVVGINRPVFEHDYGLDELLESLLGQLRVTNVYRQVAGLARAYMEYFGGYLDVRFMDGHASIAHVGL